MIIDNDSIEILLYGEEGVDLDLKRDQYKFSKASEEEKGELLKDILAFANSWRRSDAFIIIGVKEVKGGKSEVVGITEKLDDAQIQQFINTKTQKPITFSYRNLYFENKHIGVIHIPIQNRPFYLKKNYGKLKKETVYIKRGSSTDIAEIDEVAKMGVTTFVAESSHPILEIFFADKENRIILPDTLSAFSLVLNTPSQKDIPDYNGCQRRPTWSYGTNLEHPNYDYYRKLTKFTKLNRLHNSIYFAIKNTSSTVAKDVRVEIKIEDPKSIISALDECDMPNAPEPSNFTLITNYLSEKVGITHDLTAKRVSNYWLIETGVEKVQPKSTAWIDSCLFIGAIESINFCMETSIYSDDLPEPITKKLLIRVKSENKYAPLDLIKELESERFRKSEDYRKFLEMHSGKNS